MPLKTIVESKGPERPSMMIATPFLDSEKFKKGYNIPDHIQVKGIQFESDSLALDRPLLDQLTKLGIQTIRSTLRKQAKVKLDDSPKKADLFPKFNQLARLGLEKAEYILRRPVKVKLDEFFENGNLSLRMRTEGLFEADLQFSAKPDLRITYHTNPQKKKNINETMAELALLASAPFELLEEIREKKSTATLIRQINEENPYFINYPFGICQLQIAWDEKTKSIIATEPDIPQSGGYQAEVDARKSAAEKSSTIFFLATRRRKEGKISIT